MVKFLYMHGADTDLHWTTKNSWSPIYAASRYGYLEVVKFLYEHGGDVDLQVPPEDGSTPFSIHNLSPTCSIQESIALFSTREMI